MSNSATHRGIFYKVQRLNELRWKWEIAPPTCIKGLQPESGEVSGGLDEAVIAAKRAIDLQTTQFSQ